MYYIYLRFSKVKLYACIIKNLNQNSKKIRTKLMKASFIMALLCKQVLFCHKGKGENDIDAVQIVNYFKLIIKMYWAQVVVVWKLTT